MPHIVIEYSANLADVADIQDLVDAVHAAALADGLPAKASLRTRAAMRDHYRIADGSPEFAFVAVLARIGPGRSTTEKQRFLDTLIEVVDAYLTPVGDRIKIALSAEIQEIDAELRVNRNHVRTAMVERD